MAHPGRVIDSFEELSDIVIKFFEIGEILTLPLITTIAMTYLPVSQRDNFVENSHNDIIVVPILPVLKSDVRVVEEIVGEDLHIIDLFDHFIEHSIRMGMLTERIF